MEKLKKIWNRWFGPKCKRCGHSSHCEEQCAECLDWNACLDCECEKCGEAKDIIHYYESTR